MRNDFEQRRERFSLTITVSLFVLGVIAVATAIAIGVVLLLQRLGVINYYDGKVELKQIFLAMPIISGVCKSPHFRTRRRLGISKFAVSARELFCNARRKMAYFISIDMSLHKTPKSHIAEMIVKPSGGIFLLNSYKLSAVRSVMPSCVFEYEGSSTISTAAVCGNGCGARCGMLMRSGTAMTTKTESHR